MRGIFYIATEAYLEEERKRIRKENYGEDEE